MGRPHEVKTRWDKVVHIGANGRRHYFTEGGGHKVFLCKGRANTCINGVQTGGLCYGCGAIPYKCKHPGCSNKRHRGGLCVDHGATRPLCTGFNDDGTPCSSQAQKDGLCRRHGGRPGMCPCGKQRYHCPKCNPLGHLRDLIKDRVRACSPMLTPNKGPPSKAPDCLGCTGEVYDAYLESHFQDGMRWDNYGRGEGKWTIDHTTAYFSEPNPAKTEEEVRRRSRYTNTKPMWWKDNQSKGIK
jgi:hypothetical protein